MTRKLFDLIYDLIHISTTRELEPSDYKEICELMGIEKLYYTVNVDSESYKRANGYNNSSLNVIYLYNTNRKCGFSQKYIYFYQGSEYVNAYIEFGKDVNPENIDWKLCKCFVDNVYILISREKMLKTLEFSDLHDPMTGIYNTKALAMKFTKDCAVHPENNYVFVYANVKNFKFINEKVGSFNGDVIIGLLAHELVKLVGPDEGACRIGGDNFAFYIKQENLNDFIDKMKYVRINNLQGFDNGFYDFSFRLGIIENITENFSENLDNSNTAYIVGKNIINKDVVFFNEEMSNLISYNNYVIASFPKAIFNNEFVPFFQPKVNMKTGELVGLEALCRWKRAGEIVPPVKFIPVLEKKGLIHELDIAIFSETCKCIRKWIEMGLKPPVVSVNFSKKDIFVPQIEENIVSIINSYQIDHSLLEIEITETSNVSENDRFLDFVKEIKKNGLRISIDDFGTGYSSLSLIHNINADVLKIDQSYTKKLGIDDKTEILISSIIGMANRLKLQIIAEGVETAETGKHLIELGCDYAQGYYYGKPMDFEGITEIIKNPYFEKILD
ncbi:MAG: bifunctional diguanylate cyclase/phosphodiesterase [Lachnospiraceae bacterium]|nr:bifunctional diguanylate cyclase/phosphodiesterase [Lachnospiraceae bacterium]